MSVTPDAADAGRDNGADLVEEIGAGVYHATVEFVTLQGPCAHLKVTAEGSAACVRAVVSVAADAFKLDAER